MQKNLLNNIKLVLFDLDGTLVDTAPDFLFSLNEVLRKNKYDQVFLEDIRSHISDGSGMLTKVGFGINEVDANFDKYKRELLDVYKKNLTRSSKLFSDIKELITQIKILGIDYGIVTNKPYEYASPLINHFKEFKECKILICPDHLTKAKPSPEGILLACSKLDIEPKHACYVGDHIVDIDAALAADIPIVSCSYGYGDLPEKTNANELRIDNPRSLIECLKNKDV